MSLGYADMSRVENTLATEREPVEGFRPLSGGMMTQTIAVIPGDGIGKEVMPEGLRVLDAAARRHGLEFALRAP